MKRSAPMQRSWIKRGTRRVGQAARERIRDCGVLAKGRQSATRAEYAAIKRALALRSGGRCEVVLHGVRCPARAIDPCHAWNRSQGCPDSLETVYHGCRFHNQQQAAAFADGRLLCTPQGDGTFAFAVDYARDKFEARRAM